MSARHGRTAPGFLPVGDDLALALEALHTAITIAEQHGAPSTELAPLLEVARKCGASDTGVSPERHTCKPRASKAS